jgi:hypothetical protein
MTGWREVAVPEEPLCLARAPGMVEMATPLPLSASVMLCTTFGQTLAVCSSEEVQGEMARAVFRSSRWPFHDI